MSHIRETRKNICKVALLHEDATMPKRATDGSVGYDVTSIKDVVIHPGTVEKIETGVSLTPPSGYFAKCETKSRHLKENLSVKGGIIDIDYTGGVCIMLDNSGSKPFNVKKHDEVGQLVFYAFCTPALVKVDSLKETKRGDGGFGSTEALKKGAEETLKREATDAKGKEKEKKVAFADEKKRKAEEEPDKRSRSKRSNGHGNGNHKEEEEEKRESEVDKKKATSESKKKMKK